MISSANTSAYITNFLNEGATTRADAVGKINNALTNTTPKILIPNTTANAT